MSTEQQAGFAGESVPGRVSIRPQALQTLVSAIAADSAGVPVGRVTARLGDRAGILQASVTVPANVSAGMTLLDQAERLRGDVVEQTARLAGRTVRGVDIELTGVFRAARRRVV